MTTLTDLAHLDFGLRGEVFQPVATGAVPTDFTSYGFRGEPMTIYGNTGLTLALTGTSATGAVGGTTAGISRGLTGAAAAGAVGALLAASAQGLSGQAAVGGAGDVAATRQVTIALTGASTAAGTGSLAVATGLDLTGIESVGVAGGAGIEVALDLRGEALAGETGDIGTHNSNVTVALDGVAATLRVGQVHYGIPGALPEQTPILIITSTTSVDVSTPQQNIEISISL